VTALRVTRFFKEWAYSWARRTIIQQAIRMIEPARERLTSADTEQVGLEVEPGLRPILKLDALERFVFVMSVARRIFKPGLLDSSGMFPPGSSERARSSTRALGECGRDRRDRWRWAAR